MRTYMQQTFAMSMPLRSACRLCLTARHYRANRVNTRFVLLHTSPDQRLRLDVLAGSLSTVSATVESGTAHRAHIVASISIDIVLVSTDMEGRVVGRLKDNKKNLQANTIISDDSEIVKLSASSPCCFDQY